MAKLTFILDDGQEIVVPLGERVPVGRENGNDVLVDDPRISARHAEITRDAAGVFEVHDLASKLGTFVNGEKVARRFLSTGDKVEFGPLKSVFDLADMIAPPSNGATAPAAEAKSSPDPAKPQETKPPEPSAGKKKKKKGEEPPALPPAPATEKIDFAEATIPSPPLPLPTPPPPASAPISAEALAEAVKEALAKMQDSEREAIDKLKAKHNETQKRLDALNEDLGVVSKQRADSIALGAQERKQHQDHLAALTAAVAQEKQSLEEFTNARSAAETQFQEISERLQALTSEAEAKADRLEQLTAEETQLQHVTSALRETEAKHAQVVQDLENVTEHHAAKYAEWQRVTTAAEGAIRELEAMGDHKEKTLAHIQSLVQQTETLDARSKELQAQVTAKETRAQDLQVLSEAREDQIKSAEKKLNQIDNERVRLERQVSELGGVDEKLKQTRAEHAEAETRHSELKDLLKSLGERHVSAEKNVADLDSAITGLREEHAQATQAAAEAAAARQQVEENLHRIHAERATHEQTLAATRTTLITERQRLEEVQAQHRDLTQKCADLADTDSKLGACKTALAEHELKVAEQRHLIVELEESHGAHSKALEDLLSREEAAKGRLEALLGQEKDLREVLERLSAQEHEQREKFEEIRKLSAEAEQEFVAHKDEIARGTELARRELADLEVRLAPLRDWKDAMDKRYARLASLPEDSAEARELWQEMEKEKSNLRGLIPPNAGQTRSVSLREAVLKNLTKPEDSSEAGDRNGVPKSKGTLHAPPALSEEAETPEERAHVGPTGTGALISGTGQEMALKARLNRLRESVQREAMRLEFIRQERAREETRGKQGGGPGQSMMREQERQLETKVRREEELLATVQRKIEIAQVEEERRREKIAEMERKLAELKADIAEAERQRSGVRHQTDLVQTELRNYEAALDRVKRLNE